MQGVLNVLKPPGMSSHDVVAWTRRTFGLKRVGHTGTLDPAAAGVLIVCLGTATRLVEALQIGRKEYIAEATFGFQTDTLDAVGQIVREADATHLTAAALREVLPQFRGTIRQTPPLFSALKRDGRKLYELARAGAEAELEEVLIESREVEVSRLELMRFEYSEGRPRAFFRVECGGGTYIRSLVRDIGHAAGNVATMTFLTRTRNGHFSIADALPLEAIVADRAAALHSLVEVLQLGAHATIHDDAAMADLVHGRAIASPATLIALRTSQSRPCVLFLDTSGTKAALVSEIRGGAEPLCKADKVFDLR